MSKDYTIERVEPEFIDGYPTGNVYVGLTIEEYEQLANDLEVLDTLRKYFQYNDYGQWYIDMQESDFDFRSECSQEEWDNSPQKKIKDWLRRKY